MELLILYSISVENISSSNTWIGSMGNKKNWPFLPIITSILSLSFFSFPFEWFSYRISKMVLSLHGTLFVYSISVENVSSSNTWIGSIRNKKTDHFCLSLWQYCHCPFYYFLLNVFLQNIWSGAKSSWNIVCSRNKAKIMLLNLH
jgi:hypothetical protein